MPTAEKTQRDENAAEKEQHTQEYHTREARKRAVGPDADDIVAMNLGGSSGTPGAPVIIGHGLHPRFQNDPVALDHAQRLNPPGAQVPAQDPTPIDDHDYGRAARVDQVAATGHAGAVRRVDDRTPDPALESASRPYNNDASVAQRAAVTGQDTEEEEAEGKFAPGGAKARVAQDARDEVKAQADAKRHAEREAIQHSKEHEKELAKAHEKARGGKG